jgi:hypothetical protein
MHTTHRDPHNPNTWEKREKPELKSFTLTIPVLGLREGSWLDVKEIPLCLKEIYKLDF